MLSADHFRGARAAQGLRGLRPVSRFSKIPFVGLLIVLPFVTTQGCEGSVAGPLVALELETQENTLDGCTECGCRARPSSTTSRASATSPLRRSS